MYILKFIDSPDIREFNKDTAFTPAEQAILIANSCMTTIEEKMDALQYLLDHYSEEEFIAGNYIDNDHLSKETSIKNAIVRTLKDWEGALEARYDNAGYVYAACFRDKECNRDDTYDSCFFTTYEKAYEYLVAEKQTYLEKDSLRDIKVYGEIYRIALDGPKNGFTDGDRYHFDNKMRLVSVYGDPDRFWPGGDYPALLDDYQMYVPVPFKPGDIVKVDNPFYETDYGVISHEMILPERKKLISLRTSLDVYDGGFNGNGDFDFTDDTDILSLSYCSDAELPDNEQMLRVISKARKGEMDFYDILHCWGRGDLNGLVERCKT